MVEFKLDDDKLLNALAGQLAKSLPDAERSRLVDALEARLVWGNGPRTIQRLVVENADHGLDLAKNSVAWNAYEMLLSHGNCSYTWVGREPKDVDLKVNVSFNFDIMFSEPVNPTVFLANSSFYRPMEAISFVFEDKVPVLKVSGTSFYCGDHKAVNLQSLADFLNAHHGKGYVRSPANWSNIVFGLPGNKYVLPARPE